MDENRPRILMVVAFLDHLGGVQRQAWLLARELHAAGSEVAFLTARTGGLPQEETRDGIAVHRVRFPARVPLGPLKWHLLVREMSRWMIRHAGSYDLVHVHQVLWPAYAAVRAAGETGRPVLIKCGNTGERFDFAVLGRSFLLGRRMARACVEGCARIVATSERMGEELQSFGVPQERIVRIPNGVRLPEPYAAPDPTARKALGIADEDVLFLSVGALSLHKRPMISLAAFLAAAKGHPQARLWYLGDGVLRPWLQRQIMKLGRGESIRCLGPVEDPGPYLRAADGFILPSVAEGMSNALLEAMAHGLACIATRVSGSEDLIEDGRNGLLVRPDDPRGLARAIRRLIEGAALRRRLGAGAREAVLRSYTMESVAARYMRLYAEIIPWPG